MENYNVKLIKLTEESIKFKIFLETYIANSLRRICIAEVQTIAIHPIEFRKNDTILTDQQVAHRIGQIPIKSNKVENVPYFINCECSDYCNKCSIKYQLNMKNNTTDNIDITSNNIQCGNANFEPLKNVIITRVSPNQHLNFFALGRKGIGKMNAKWSPVSKVVFKPIPRISFKKIDDDELKESFVNNCHKKVFSLINNEIEICDIEECDLCKKCEQKARENKLDGFKFVYKDFKNSIHEKICEIESVGQLKPEKIFIMAIDVLIDKLCYIEECLNKL